MKPLSILPLAALAILASCNSKSASTEAPGKAIDSVDVDSAVVHRADTASVVITATPKDDPKPTADKAVVIDFSATWCGPCQQFKPIYHKVAAEYAAKATFYTADVDDCKTLAEKYEISSIPCVVVLKDGAEPVTHVGYMEEDEFKALVQNNI